MKKPLAILLALCMLAGCAPAATTGPAAGTEPAQAPIAEPTAAPAPTLDKDLVILYTNDVHCGVDEAIGYAGLSAYKKEMEADSYVALVDAGDFVQGEPIGTVTKGEDPVKLMNLVGYDVATVGNHEFDYGMDRFLELTKAAEFPIVSCNFTDLATGNPVLDAYKMLEFNGVQVAFVGVSTPKTITSSTPAYFQNDQGDYIYGFQQDETGEALYACVQKAVDAAREAGANYVILLGHLGIEAGTSPWMSTEVIQHTNGIDAVIDGHSHSVVNCERVKNKDGERVLLTQTGTKLNNIGMLLISKEGNLSTGLISGYTEKDPEVEKAIADMQASFEEQIQQVVAKTDVDLTITMPDNPEIRIVRNMETNLGDLCADAYRTIGEADIGFINGGGVRKSIAAGDITYGDIIEVHPFGNNLCVIEATGAQILDALEMGARVAPEETGGFLQVSGLTYEIHTYLPSGVKLDENGMFLSVDGEYRVKNVLVGGEPLDPAKTYTLASHDYMLKNAGDGFTMFEGCKVLKDMVMVDNQMLITFITGTLQGVVGTEYADPYGQGRITIVDTKPAA